MRWSAAGAGWARDGGGQGDHVHCARLLQLRRLRRGQGRGARRGLGGIRKVMMIRS